MRQWDTETGELIERMDLKCEQSCLREFRAPYLTLPLRMKGYHWAGVAFTYETDPHVVCRLFDRAVSYGKPRGYTVVLEQPDQRTGQTHRDTALPFSGSSYRPDKVQVPEKILQMRKMNSYLGDLRSVRNKTFYKQAVFMKDYEDAYPFQGDFFHYFPTYRDLNTAQLRGYFSWRTKLRGGSLEQIPVSAAYIYIYELLNGIGALSGEARLKKLRAFLDAASESGYFSRTDFRTAEAWIPMLGVVLNVPPEVIAECSGDDAVKRDTMLEVLARPREYSDAQVLEALKYFAGTKLDKTPVLSADPARGAYLFAEAWRIGTETAFGSGKTIFPLIFGARKTVRWYPLVNAVYYEEQQHADCDYILNAMHSFHCRNGMWTEDGYDGRSAQMALFSEFIHAADCRFRRYLKTGRYLQAKDAEAWVLPVIEAAAEADRKAVLEASRPKITIDLSGLDQIRKDALSTQNSLLTEEELQAEPQPVNTVPEPEEKSDGFENEPEPALPLDPVHIQILQRLLNGTSVQELIRQNHLLPAVIADTVNEVFYDEIGDTVLLCENDSLYLVDDYREDVEQLLKGGAG